MNRQTAGALLPLFISLVFLLLLIALLIPQNAAACGAGLLIPYKPRLPAARHRYRFCPEPGWNAVAIRPPNNSSINNDLQLVNFPVSSTLPAEEVDIILIDKNHEELIQHTVDVIASQEPTTYTIEWATQTELLSEGIYGPYQAESNAIVRIWDAALKANETYYMSLKQLAGDGDLHLALYASDENNENSFRQGRIQAAVQAQKNNPPSQEQFMQFTPVQDDNYGLVVWQQGAGTETAEYYLYVDATPPESVLSINGDETYTNTPFVSVSLSTKDHETDIATLCLFETETDPEICDTAYANSQFDWEFGAEEGIKALSASITNHAGQTTVVSDSIILDTIPPQLTISYPKSNQIITSTGPILIEGVAQDNLSGVAEVWLQLNEDEAWRSADYSADQNQWAYSWLAPENGDYTVTITATDKAGNVTAPVTTHVSVETTGKPLTYLPLVTISPPPVFLPIVSSVPPYHPGGCVFWENNDFNTAVPITFDIEYCGFLDDPYDFYTFELLSEKTITVSVKLLEPLYGNRDLYHFIRLYLYAPFREDPIEEATNSNQEQWVIITETLPPETYQILILAIQDDDTYPAWARYSLLLTNSP